MSDDWSRNKLDFRLHCFKHPNQALTMTSNSNIGASSAMEVNIHILVHPCQICTRESDDIKDAVILLMDVKRER